MAVIVRTHGGLGNQLFQILYGRLYAKAVDSELYELHDSNYSHRFDRTPAISRAQPPSRALHRYISAVRIPKVLARITGKLDQPFRMLGGIYLDGYFQRFACFSDFSESDICVEISSFRNEIGVAALPLHEQLVHLRLGDFFESEETKIQHVVQRLRSSKHGSDVITNEPAILEVENVARIVKDRSLRVVNTDGWCAAKLMTMMCNYRTIDANSSTMTFWASVLSGVEVSPFPDSELEKLRIYLTDMQCWNR